MSRAMRSSWRRIAVLLAALACVQAHGGELVINEGFRHADLTAWSETRQTVGIQQAATGMTSEAGIAAEMTASGWQPMMKAFVLPYSEDALWQRVTLRLGSNGPSRLLLDVANPLLDELDAYLLVDGKVVQQLRLGDTRPAANRVFADRFIVFPVDLPDSAPLTIVLRAQSHGALSLPVALWNEAGFIAGRQGSLLAYSFIYGAILSALLVFLFVTRHSREPGFHAALLFLLVLTVYQAHVDGLPNQYLAINGVWWGEYKSALLGLLVVVIGTLFANRMLQLFRHLPASRHALRACYITYGLLFPLALATLGASVLPTLTAAILFYALGSVLLGLYALRRQLPLAGIYTTLAALFLFGATGSVLERFSIIGSSESSGGWMLSSIVLQVLVLGYVLAQRIRHENRARRIAEDQAISARKRALAAEWHMAYELEREVERQTDALSQTMKELRDANHQLAEMSLHDGLTGLHNRRHFDERFPALVQQASRRREPLAVMMLDIDHFKRVNDDHGHLVGDDCLRQTAGAMRRVLGRSTDLLARYGGEEFVAVLPATGELDAMSIAERIRTAVAATPIVNGEKTLQVSISIGVAVRVPATSDGTDLLRDADAALYRAKKGGRNRVERC